MISVDVISKRTMSEKSSDEGYLSTEQSRVKVTATVMMYDDVSRQWIFSNSCSSPSKVHIYQHMANNSFRIVGRSVEDRMVTINFVLSKNLRYNQATPVFHQWRDNRQSIYGLQFLNKEDADSFADVMISSLELLNLAAEQKLYNLHHHEQQDHHQQHQSHSQREQQEQQQTLATQRYRCDQQYGGREQPGAEEFDQPDMTQNHSEDAHPNHHHHRQQQQLQDVQSSPLPSSQTAPFTSAARVHPSSLAKTPFVVTRATSTGPENPNPVSGGSSLLGPPTPPEATTPSSAPPPPPPPPPPAAPIDSQPPPAKPSGIDLASALKGVKLRETPKSAESDSKETTKSSGLQTMTLGRATKVVPVFPPGSGTATVGRASGGPPPATRPKLNVMSEMEKKLRERKEKSESGMTATDQQFPRRGAAGLQDLFQSNQPQQRTGIAVAAASEEEISLHLLSSAENNVAVQRTPEVKAARGSATTLSAVHSHGNNPRCSILPAELEAVKVELVTKITQELENTKQEIINAIRRELTKSVS